MATVAIFGIGPAGIATGWAALRAGYRVQYFSNTDSKSTLHGCQYLHAPIPVPPQFKIAQTRVTYSLHGTPFEYRRKVYGLAWDGDVSPEDLAGEHDAWDIRATYDAMWEMVTQSRNVAIVPADVKAEWLDRSTGALSKFAHVVSTVPAPSLCKSPVYHPSQEGHLFRVHTIKAAGDVSPYKYPPGEFSDFVKCDGTSAEPWYRTARVFGYRTVEWPRQFQTPTYSDVRVATVRKPLQTDCDCHPEIIRLGRYGAWRKGILVHQVYADAVKLFNGEWVSE